MLELKKIIQLQVSKWVKIPVLLDIHEMRELLHTVPFFQVYDVQRLTEKKEGIYSQAVFLDHYASYVELLKKGEIPLLDHFRSIFSAVWSVTESALYQIPSQNGKRLLKVLEPAVQTQINQIRYDAKENIFRSQVYSGDSISWGIQIGFPFLFMDPNTFEAKKTHSFPNMALFIAIQRWIRHATIPTPFLIQGNKVVSPMRMGKECFTWIGMHPQLQTLGIEIARRN